MKHDYLRPLKANLADALRELRSTGPAWCEILFSCMALAAGGWALYQPYVSEWFELSPYWAAAVFYVVGSVQLVAFLGRVFSCRQRAAILNCALWCGVSWVIIRDQVPGWMTSLGPVLAIAEVIVWMLLEREEKRGKGSSCA